MIADVHYRLLVKWKFSFSLFGTRFNRSPKTVTSFAGVRFLYPAEKQGWWWAVNLQEDVYQLQKLWKPSLNEPQRMKIEEVSFQRRRMSTGRVSVLFNQRWHFVQPREYQAKCRCLQRVVKLNTVHGINQCPLCTCINFITINRLQWRIAYCTV